MTAITAPNPVLEPADSINIRTIEELTLHSLDRSIEGIEMLRSDSLKCGQALRDQREAAFGTLSDFACSLRSFYVFENDICELFSVDTGLIRDPKGDLSTEQLRIGRALNSVASLLDAADYAGLCELLSSEIPAVLDRFQDLIPALRNHIENEYVLTECPA